MRLSLIFELLLIFVLLAFAASAAVGKYLIHFICANFITSLKTFFFLPFIHSSQKPLLHPFHISLAILSHLLILGPPLSQIKDLLAKINFKSGPVKGIPPFSGHEGIQPNEQNEFLIRAFALF